MITDPIVEEVRRYRREHAARYGNDLNRIVEALREQERHSKHEFVNPGPKRFPELVGRVCEEPAEYKTKPPKTEDS